MIIDDIIAAVVIVVIIGLAVGYIIKAKRSGQKCIGCPDSKTCSGNCSSCSSCGDRSRTAEDSDGDFREENSD